MERNLELRKGIGLNRPQKLRAKSTNPESKLQIACIAWFRMQWRQYERLLWATPNGGKRDAREAARLKTEGVLSGVADITLSVPKKQASRIGTSNYAFKIISHGLYVELKYGPGKQSAAQIAFEQAVTAQGYQYSVCRTLEEFMNIINTYLK